jgi:lipoprotein NlpI
MSYILNALKKSEQERQGAGAATRDRAHVLKERLGADAEPAAPAPRRPPWPWIAGAGGVAVAGLATVLALVGGPEPPATTAKRTAAPAEVVASANQPRAGEPTAVSPAPGADAEPVSPPQLEAPVAGVALLEPPGPVAEPSAALPGSGGAGRAAAPGPEPTASSSTPVARPPRIASALPVPSLPIAAALPAPRRPAAGDETPPAERGAPQAVVAVAEPVEPPAAGDASALAATPRLAPPPPAESEPPQAVVAGAEPVDPPAAGDASALAATSRLDPPPPAEHEPQLEVELAALPPPAGGAEASRSAMLFNDHAWEYERDGLYDSAVDSFTRAIRLRPDYAEAYFGRGWVNERLGQLESAVADYSWAIKVRPGFAAAYNNRGVVQLYRNRLEEAERDFEAALAAGDDEARRYAMLWRYVAIERAGGDGRARLAADARKADLGRWPGVLAKFFLGEASTEHVLEEAADRDPLLRREKLSVAYFFLGQHHLLRGDPIRAKAFFRDTLATGVSAFVQYAAAERELERLAKLR